MFFNAEDDEQDFMSSGGSKLANLFGMDKASRQGGNESLTYTAPKQPKKKEGTPDGGATPAVVIASVVHAYKYLEGKYVSQGKLGAALLANHGAKDYRILLYVTRQQQVTNAKITLNFAFNIQQNNYASFYDDARQTWSIMFESADAAEKFAKEVALAKVNSAPGPITELVQQELTLGEGGPLEAGDSVEVKYIGWLLTGGTFGKIFDQSQPDNNFRFKVGRGKVIKGWDQGMLGMKKGAKKLLVIPPSLAYGAQGAGERIPPDSTLIFQVQIVRVKLQKGESPQESPAPTPAPTPVPVPLPEHDDLEDGVKSRTRSINEQISQSPDSNKAKLISRMARMGQPMLPFQGAVPAQPDDSDEEMHHIDHSNPAPTVKPTLPTKPRTLSNAGMAVPSGHVIITQTQPTAVHQTLPMMTNQPMMMTSDGMMSQSQPAFLQNLPGAQQLAVYQNPNNYLQQQQQQQQAALLQQQQQQQQQLLHQQQQQQQAQLLGQGLMMGGIPGASSAFGAPVSLAPQVSAPPQQSSADALAPALLSETRQQNTEVRIGLSKMSDKVDKILEKIEHLNTTVVSSASHTLGALAPYGSSMPAPSMEANVLMQNITRIVQENERLKKDLYDQSHKVQEQNERIANLLEKNQKYVEQSHSVLEQRNEGYKNTATQSQARVLALEQEKVHLATELSTASAQISTLQLELSEYRKREGELRQTIQMTTNTNTATKDELDKLRQQREEDEQKIATLNTSIREEKQARKAADVKLTSLVEELTDLKAAHSTLEKNLTERKRKAAEERRKMEEDMEDAKISYEQTIESLRERIRKQKSSVDTETESKMSKIEEDISREWQIKCDRMMSAVTEKHNRQIEDLKSEKEELLRKVDELEKKIITVRSSGSSTEKQITLLQDELADMKIWKDKYDTLRSQAASMKEKYEKRLEELEKDKEEDEERRSEIVEKAKEQRQDLLQQIQQLQQQVQQLRAQANVATQHKPAVTPTVASADVATEVKKIMNSVYQSLRSEFEADESYAGSEVLATILNAIKQTTLKLVNQAASRQEESEEEEEEEEEDEEEEEKKEEAGVDEVDEEVIEEVTQPDSEAAVRPVAETGTQDGRYLAEEASRSENIEQKAATETVSHVESGTQRSQSPVSQSQVPQILETLSSLGAVETENEIATSDDVSGIDTSEDVVVKNGGVSEKDVVNQNEALNSNVESADETAQKEDSDVENYHNAHENLPEIEDMDVKQDKAVEQNGFDPAPVSDTHESEEKTALVDDQTAEQSKRASLEASTLVAPKAPTDTDARDPPPPLFDDDDEDDEDSPLFGQDSIVSDTLGIEPAPKSSATPTDSKTKTTPGRKLDLTNEEDLKPQPPPPLFGDDSDDDDLDWLS
ncbi:FK506-binding protein 15-like [Physella acuta]|uniref:FK506-binding protein 15-like n=1 Tax=Physella acuta TaxID=109671 RepID=UPI0027DDE689|nr:FK506-binding protein 15-like [Physella acuta]